MEDRRRADHPRRGLGISAGFKSSGDNVVLLSSAIDGFSTSTIKHGGEGNFAAIAYSASDRELLVNEIGCYFGPDPLAERNPSPRGTAEGAWSISTHQ